MFRTAMMNGLPRDRRESSSKRLNLWLMAALRCRWIAIDGSNVDFRGSGFERFTSATIFNIA
jgi:hypothetical protein